jgi:hypothetical protein
MSFFSWLGFHSDCTHVPLLEERTQERAEWRFPEQARVGHSIFIPTRDIEGSKGVSTIALGFHLVVISDKVQQLLLHP